MLKMHISQFTQVEVTRNNVNEKSKREVYLTTALGFEGTNIETLTDKVIEYFNVPRDMLSVDHYPNCGKYWVTFRTYTKANANHVNEWPTYSKRFTERGIMLHRNLFIVVAS
ncbi:MAG: hypothetical protein COB09_18735 [Thalassobium sp.]|nr:MAG: hypothetical protein COB09_18735 [Thalassobium sp.]